MIEEFDEIKYIITNGYERLPDINEDRTDLISKVAERVAFLMDTNMELFFNHLYRMDVDEKKVHEVLYGSDSEEPVNILLAKLIVERQIKRLETKRKFKQDDWIDI